jgi:hypothetical protein
MLDSPGRGLVSHQIDSVIIFSRHPLSGLSNACPNPNFIKNVILLDFCLNPRIALQYLNDGVQVPYSGIVKYP